MSEPIQDDSASALPTAPRPLEDLIFVAFNSRVFAVDRYDGTQVWKFKVPSGGGFVALLLDGDRLIVSSNGYTYCLDPWRGTSIWSQTFTGEGIGIPTLVSLRGSNSTSGPGAAQAAAAAAAAAQHSSATMPHSPH